MIPPTFPRAQGTISQESYLTLVLSALIEQAGGELRISSQSLEKIDERAKILIDWDVTSQQLVIRTASPSLVIAQVRGTGWTSPNLQLSPQGFPSSQPGAPSSPQTDSPSSHRVWTEEDIIRKLEERMRKDMLRQWREQGEQVMSNMPPPDGKM